MTNKIIKVAKKAIESFNRDNPKAKLVRKFHKLSRRKAGFR